MSIKSFLKVKVLIVFLVAAVISVSVVINNAYLSIATVLIGILFMLLVKSRVKGVLVDERVISVSGRASYITYTVVTLFLAMSGLFLIVSSGQTGEASAEFIGVLFCYTSMLLIGVYAISYHYTNKKYGGSS